MVGTRALGTLNKAALSRFKKYKNVEGIFFDAGLSQPNDCSELSARALRWVISHNVSLFRHKLGPGRLYDA